eukprot:448312_1
MPKRNGKSKRKHQQHKHTSKAKSVTNMKSCTLKVDKKKLLVFGYMRMIHNEMMQIPMDIVNLCLLMYYIPYYSTEIKQNKPKPFVLKNFQFYRKIIYNTSTDTYEYTLSLTKNHSYKSKCIHGLITLYHELILPSGDIIDINIATFTDTHRDFKVEFKLLQCTLNFVTMNTKVVRIGDNSILNIMRYTEFNPYGNMSTKLDIHWNVSDIKKCMDLTSVLSERFDNNYWCLKYESKQYIALRLLCLPVNIEKIKVTCSLNNKYTITKMLRLFKIENECKFYVDFQGNNSMGFDFSVAILEVYAFDGKVKKEEWNENGMILRKSGSKLVSLM